MGLRSLEMLLFFQCGDRFYTSESDVYRRQILTYKDGPCTERLLDVFIIHIHIPKDEINRASHENYYILNVWA